jgi:hypothetical protein
MPHKYKPKGRKCQDNPETKCGTKLTRGIFMATLNKKKIYLFYNSSYPESSFLFH